MNKKTVLTAEAKVEIDNPKNAARIGTVVKTR
jgi:hypothetical protein